MKNANYIRRFFFGGREGVEKKTKHKLRKKKTKIQNQKISGKEKEQNKNRTMEKWENEKKRNDRPETAQFFKEMLQEIVQQLGSKKKRGKTPLTLDPKGCTLPFRRLSCVGWFLVVVCC